MRDLFPKQRIDWAEKFGFLSRFFVLILPTVFLTGAVSRYPDWNNVTLWMGVGFQLIVCSLSFFSYRNWRQPLGPSVITLYLIALAWMWFGDTVVDAYNHLVKAVLLMVPLVVFAVQTLTDSGAPSLRKAQVLAYRLAERRDWPEDLLQCRNMPEVKTLKSALGKDASPVLHLLNHPRQAVRVGALAALEGKRSYKAGQAELVVQVAQHADNPALKAQAILALGWVSERPTIEQLSGFLTDPSPDVRKATANALLWDSETRWPWLRFAVRKALSEPVLHNDGPLLTDVPLSQEAINDLTAWCAEKGLISARSAVTLGAHYNRCLTDGADPKILQLLKSQLSNAQTPAIFRLELGKLLQHFQVLDKHLLDKLVDSSNPAPLRLIACETILANHLDDDAMKSRTTITLRELARLPNREIALATADVIQRRLGVDMGLGIGLPLPATHSKQAAEIARRVMHWATQYDQEEEELEDSHMF